MKKIDLDDEYEELEEDTQKDKYLIFHLSSEDYGIDISSVVEIIGMQRITEIPDMPDFIKGVINLRGKIIPLVDMRVRFHLEFKPYNERTCIIIIFYEESYIGLIVDSVLDVTVIPEENIEIPPQTNKGTKNRFISGLAKIQEKVKIILNIQAILDNELELIKEALNEEGTDSLQETDNYDNSEISNKDV